jgi:glycolate oxidase FAD binding subunit
MKDVAGYDLRKLFIGSWGTLGAIVEATLRLYPVPEASSTLVARLPEAADAREALGSLLASPLQPVALELLTPNALPGLASSGSGLTLLARLEGRREAVARLERDVASLLEARGRAAVCAVRDEESAAIWRARSRFLEPARDQRVLQAKWSVPISRVADMLGEVARLPGAGSTAAHAGSGVGRTIFPLLPSVATALSSFVALRRWVESAGGFAYLERAPRSLLEEHGDLPPRSDYELMRKLRTAIDPAGVFNPGRAFEAAREEVR